MANARSSMSKLMKVSGLFMTTKHVAYKQATRTLFSHEILGLDTFHRFRSQINDRLRDVKDKFAPRMEEYLETETNTIFTDDLKNMLAVAETDSDLAIMEKMIKRYYTQSSESVLKQFTFGPVILRMLYDKNKVDLAFSLSNDPELSGLFDPISCCVILMDMLYEVKRYDDALSAFHTFVNKRRDLSATNDFITLYPSDPTTIAFACYYKLDTPEALEKTKALVADIDKSGANLTNRGSAFVALLALSQNDPVFGYEVLGMVRASRLTSIRNLKIQCQMKLGRFDDALALLSSVLRFHPSDDTIRANEVFPDTLEAMETALKASGNNDLLKQFETVKEQLTSQGHVSALTLKQFNDEPIRHRRGARDPQVRQYGESGGGVRDFYRGAGRSDFGRDGGGGDGGGGGGFRRFAQPWRRLADDGDFREEDSRRPGRGFWAREDDQEERYGGSGRPEGRRWGSVDRGWGGSDRMPPSREEFRGRGEFRGRDRYDDDRRPFRQSVMGYDEGR